MEQKVSFENKFSFFGRPVMNKVPNDVFDLRKTYLYLTGPMGKRATEAVRAETDEEKQRKMKSVGFDYVTFSGLFSYCQSNCLTQHSSLMCLDLDHLNEQYSEMKEALKHDPHFETQLLFTSPRGNGLKWVVPIDLRECDHLHWFLALQEYVRQTYGVEVDERCKDVCRACFLPYDPEAYVTPRVLPF